MEDFLLIFTVWIEISSVPMTWYTQLGQVVQGRRVRPSSTVSAPESRNMTIVRNGFRNGYSGVRTTFYADWGHFPGTGQFVLFCFPE